MDSDLDVKYFITGELEENEIGPISSDRFYTNLEVEHCCRYKPEYPKPSSFHGNDNDMFCTPYFGCSKCAREVCIPSKKLACRCTNTGATIHYYHYFGNRHYYVFGNLMADCFMKMKWTIYIYSVIQMS